MNLRLFAHAGEAHGDAVESTQHFLDIDPLIAVPAILAVMVLIPWLLGKLFKSKSLPMMVGLIELFFVGILSYAVLPALSIISLSVGFFLAFAVAFGGIAGSK